MPDAGGLQSVTADEGRGPLPRAAAVLIVVSIAATLIFAVVTWRTAPSSAPNEGPEDGFAWGVPMNETNSGDFGCTNAAGHYCYGLEIFPGPYNLGNIALGLRSESGGNLAWPVGPPTDTVLLVSVYGFDLAQYNTSWASWNILVDSSVPLAGDSIVIATGGEGPAYGLAGDSIVALLSGPDGSGMAVSSPLP